MINSIFRLLLEQNDFKEDLYWARKFYDDNNFILREGERTGKVFLILSGTVRVLGDIELKNKHHIRPGIKDLQKGEVFGELSMVDGLPHSASILAVSKCEIAVIDCQALKEYFNVNRELGIAVYQELVQILAGRFRKANDQVLSLLGWGLKVHGIEKHLD